MKIGNSADKPVVTPTGTPSASTPSATAANRPASEPVEASAQVALSSTAASLLSSADADFNASKVESISQSIDRGDYKVNAEAIADKLIANAAELLSGNSPKA
jgi:negative regulator of flagellin synthesis FlgM